MAPTLLIVALVALAALCPTPAAQHVCVFCSGPLTPPDADTFRLACKVDSPEDLTCPVTGPMPDCSDFTDVSDGEPISCSPDPRELGPRRRRFSCPSLVSAFNQTWDIRAVIMNPACPVDSTIWVECAGDTPFCQWQGSGIRGVGPNNVAAGTALPVGMEPAMEEPAMEETMA